MEINNTTHERLLDAKSDSKLSFNTLMDDICKKAGLKLNALSRISPHVDVKKKTLLINAFLMSQFNHCQIIWMCHNRTKNNKINRFHERCLCLLHNGKKYFFHDLLEKDSSGSIDHGNLRALATEMYRMYNGMPLKTVQEIFPLKPQGE